MRKYAWLASRGNPTILILLFVEPIYVNPLGRSLRDHAEVFASRAAGFRYLRYLEAQTANLLGRGGFTSTRTELIERHGFDTKLAMHVLRLGFQGIEYMETGKLTLPMPAEERAYCFHARRGEIPLAEVVERAQELKQRLTRLVESDSPLRVQPDERVISDFLVAAYEEHWQGRDES